MFDRAIKVEALQDFKAHLHGELIAPGDDTYDSARKVWNGMIDKYPAIQPQNQTYWREIVQIRIQEYVPFLMF